MGVIESVILCHEAIHMQKLHLVTFNLWLLHYENESFYSCQVESIHFWFLLCPVLCLGSFKVTDRIDCHGLK